MRNYISIIVCLLMASFNSYGQAQAVSKQYKFNIESDNFYQYMPERVLMTITGVLSIAAGRATIKGWNHGYDTGSGVLMVGAGLGSFIGATKLGNWPESGEFKESDFFKNYRRFKLNLKASHATETIVKDKLLYLVLNNFSQPQLTDFDNLQALINFTTKVKELANKNIKSVNKVKIINNQRNIEQLNNHLNSSELYFQLINALGDHQSEENLHFAYTFYMLEFYESYQRKFGNKK